MRWCPILALLLAACGSSAEPCATGTCIIKGITLDLPLPDPGTYDVQVDSPGAPSGATCHITVSTAPPQASCQGMTATVDGGAVKGLVLPSTFTNGGILSVTRNGAPFLSGSFDVRQQSSSDCGSCPDPYAVVYVGQGS